MTDRPRRRALLKRANNAGSLTFDKGKNLWVARVTLPDGRRRKATARTKTEGEAKLRRLQAEADAGVPVGDGNTTVGEWLTWWAAEVLPGRVQSPNTVENYRIIVRCYLVPLLGSRRLRSLTVEQVEAALRAARRVEGDAPLSRGTLLRLRSVLGMAVREAERRGQVATNVARLAVLPSGTPEREGRQSFTAEQARSLVAAASEDRLEAPWVMALMRGLRRGELLGLTWRDVDLDATPAVLHLRGSLKWEPTGVSPGPGGGTGSER